MDCSWLRVKSTLLRSIGLLFTMIRLLLYLSGAVEIHLHRCFSFTKLVCGRVFSYSMSFRQPDGLAACCSRCEVHMAWKPWLSLKPVDLARKSSTRAMQGLRSILRAPVSFLTRGVVLLIGLPTPWAIQHHYGIPGSRWSYPAEWRVCHVRNCNRYCA